MSSSSATTRQDSEMKSTDASNGPTILIADAFEPSGIAALEQLGCNVHVDASLQDDALTSAIGDHDPQILIVRSTKVKEAAIAAGQKLSLIVRAGAGYDNIDIKTASSQGISVANCPGMNALAVAELTWGLILSCDRRIPDQTRDLRDGIWKKKEYAKASGLYGRTLGIVGLGRIGMAVARRGQAFGMKVVAWSLNLTDETADQLGVGCCKELVNLARMSDVVSVNIAANDQTKHLIDSTFCEALRPGAIIVNTSRGSVIDHNALKNAIQKNNVRAGLDVFANEPGSGDPSFSDEIVQEPGVYGTHHVGASTSQAQEAIASEVVRIIRIWQESGEVTNCVNLATRTSASQLLSVRHLNKPGVLAHIFEIIGRDGTNVEEMENVIYAESIAACARIQIDRSVNQEALDSIRNHEHVISVNCTAIQDSITSGDHQ